MSLPQQAALAMDFLKTSYRFDTFQEPRGVMRILQFVFGIWGFFACRDFSVTLRMDCNDKFTQTYEIEYPFEFSQDICRRRINNQTLLVSLESSSGAQLFALTAALSVLYALFIIFVYAYLDEMYKSKPEFPMADFALTAFLAFFWMVGTFAFSSGGSVLKKTINEDYIGKECTGCVPHVGSFTDLSIAYMIGFLNFFLWASDLWFLYKETVWFQKRNQILNQQMYGQQQQQFGGQEQFGGQAQFTAQPQYDQQQQQYGYDQQQMQQQPQQQQFGYTEQQYGGQQQQQYGQPSI